MLGVFYLISERCIASGDLLPLSSVCRTSGLMCRCGVTFAIGICQVYTVQLIKSIYFLVNS